MSRVLLTLCLLTAPALAERPLWLDHPDRHAHLWLSYGLTLTLAEVLEGPEPTWSPALGTVVATTAAVLAVGALGLVKEYLVDPKADGMDLVADGLGISAAVLVEWAIPF